MYYNKNTVAAATENIISIFEKYKNIYFDVKSEVKLNDDLRIVWSNCWTAPYNSDFISEINDSTMLPRSILKSKPRKIYGCSKYYYDDRKPVYAVFWGDSDEPEMEEFTVHCEGHRIMLRYICGSQKLYEVSAEYFDDDNNVQKYECGVLQRSCAGKLTDIIEIRGRRYYRENGVIVRADVFGDFNSAAPLTWYDDERYEEIGSILPAGCPRMNPEWLCQYCFNYGNEGVPETFTRKNYAYKKISENTWKFGKNLNKKYFNYGIKDFYIK